LKNILIDAPSRSRREYDIPVGKQGAELNQRRWFSNPERVPRGRLRTDLGCGAAWI